MGMGEFPAGTTLAGMDAQLTTTVRVKRPPVALAFDGTTKDYVLDEDGLYEEVHPVDAKMFLRCRTGVGSVTSAVDVGQKLSSIRYIEKNKIQAQVDDAIRQCTSDMVASGEVALLGNIIDISVRGRLSLIVNYMNLITQRKMQAKSELR